MGAQTALLAAGVVAVPGIGASFALFPGRELGLATRLASAYAFGYTLIALTAIVLALGGWLTREHLLVVLSVATVATWTVAARRGEWRLGRPGWPAPGWTGAVGVGALAGFAAFHWSLSPYLQFGVATPFRYWADGLELAQAHAVPAHTLQWGALYPVTVSKIGLNAFDAAADLFLQASTLQAMAALTWLGAVGLFLALWATADELGMGATAPLLPLLILAPPAGWPLSGAAAQDAVLFRAEDFGRGLAFAALAIAVHCLRTRTSAARLVSAAVVFGVAAVVHLIPVLVCGVVLVVYAAAAAVSMRDLRRQALRLVAFAVPALLVYAAVLLASGGDIGLEGARPSAYASAGGVDPTAYFRTGERRPLGADRLSAAQLVDRYAERTWNVGSAHTGAGIAALVVLAAAALLAAVLLERRLLPVVAAAVGLGLALVVAAIGFERHYALMIQSTFGERRLYAYAALPACLLGLAAVEAVAGRAGRIHAAIPAVVVAAAAAVLAAGSVAHPPMFRSWQDAASNPSVPDSVFALVSRDVPCDARIVTNFRSEGMFEAVTGRRSIMEGMSPYLRPAMLEQVIGVVQRTRAFLRAPAAGRAFLARAHVGYVLLAPRTVHIGQDGKPYVARSVSGIPWLHLIGTAAGVQLYVVDGVRRAAAAQPRVCPVAGAGS